MGHWDGCVHSSGSYGCYMACDNIFLMGHIEDIVQRTCLNNARYQKTFWPRFLCVHVDVGMFNKCQSN